MSSTAIYNQIILLRDQYSENIEQHFTYLIREIDSWSSRPPLVSNHPNQDDSYRYDSDYFFIHSKSIDKNKYHIEQNWEEFKEDVKNSKHNKLIFVFCSLFTVSNKILDDAISLNRAGKLVIIFSGDDWNNLSTSGIKFTTALQYLKLLAKSKNLPNIDSIENIIEWSTDKTLIYKTFRDNTAKLSGTFLRRFKHRFHEIIYVKRLVENKIDNYIRSFNPHILKRATHSDSFKQIIILRDTSGSGKTTFSINLTSSNIRGLTIGTTASQDSIDSIIDKLFDYNNYPNFGLEELYAINKPIVLMVDSLDEVPTNFQLNKKREIKSLLRRIEELNESAKQYNFALFPIIIIFSVREEYWRTWEADFEGRLDVAVVKKTLSNFNDEEFDLALKNYSNAYNFTILNHINSKVRDILSVPINLEIFSEANHYEGDIVVDDIWEGKILTSYFYKKEESLSKHYIEGYNSDQFVSLLGYLAFDLISNKRLHFSKNDYENIIFQELPNLSPYKESILTSLKSEQIIQSDVDDVNKLTFRYNRFIEYLVATHIIYQVIKTSDFGYIDTVINIIYASKIISIYGVLNNIKHVAGSNDSEIEKKIIEYYSQSEEYLNHLLPEYRGQLSRGQEIDEDSIKAIITKNYIQSPTSTWDIFFIISAKKTLSSKENIITCFEIAWETNKIHNFRWKLINKIASRGLLIQERIILKLIKNGNSREWEEYLGKIIESDLQQQFLELWEQIRGENAFRQILRKIPLEWSYADRLLDIIFRGELYIPGDIHNNQPEEKNYIILESKRNKSLPKLNINEQEFADNYIKLVKEGFETLNDNIPSFPYQIKNISQKVCEYINETLSPLLNGNFGNEQMPFINYLMSQLPKSKSLIRILFDHDFLSFPINLKDSRGTTLFQQILKSQSNDKSLLFELVFTRGYEKSISDEEIIIDRISNLQDLEPNEIETTLVAFSFLKIKEKSNYKDFNLIYREICFLLCLKFRTIFYFRFGHMVQLVNNALEHYSNFGSLFLNALECYKYYDELSVKPSFIKKIKEYNVNNRSQLEKFEKLLYDLFPELF